MANNCTNCTTPNVNVTYAMVELTEARHERQVKRLWIAIIILALAWFLTNIIWIGVFSSYDYSSEAITYTQDGQGTNIIGDSNNVNGTETDNSQEEAD